MRPFWLGPLSVGAPLQLPAVTPTVTVEGAQPIDLSQGLTLRLGGVAPATIVASEDDGYGVTLDACRGFDLTGPVQGGVFSAPGSVTIDGSSGLGCTRGATAPTVRTGTITLTRRAVGDNRVTVATTPFTYRVVTG